MPTPTYIPLATKTLVATATSVTFSSISQAYRDLVLVMSGTPTGGDIYLYYNADETAANYPFVNMRGSGTAATSASGTLNTIMYALNGQSVTNIFDYSATNKHKSSLTRFDHATNGTHAVAARWANTAAITSVKVGGNATFPVGFVFTLYGIAA